MAIIEKIKSDSLYSHSNLDKVVKLRSLILKQNPTVWLFIMQEDTDDYELTAANQSGGKLSEEERASLIDCKNKFLEAGA